MKRLPGRVLTFLAGPSLVEILSWNPLKENRSLRALGRWLLVSVG